MPRSRPHPRTKKAEGVIPRHQSWWPVALWAGMIFFLSGVESFPREVAPLLRWDKLAHVLLYAGLGFLLARALSHSRPGGLPTGLRIMTVLLTVGYGVFDEWRQSFVPGRFASAADLAYDALGGVLGQWVWFRFGAWAEQVRLGSGRIRGNRDS